MDAGRSFERERRGRPLWEDFAGGCESKPLFDVSFRATRGTATKCTATLGKNNRGGGTGFCSWNRLLAEGNSSAPSLWLAHTRKPRKAVWGVRQGRNVVRCRNFERILSDVGHGHGKRSFEGGGKRGGCGKRVFDHGLRGLHGLKKTERHEFFNPRNPWSISTDVERSWIVLSPVCSANSKSVRRIRRFSARKSRE